MAFWAYNREFPAVIRLNTHCILQATGEGRRRTDSLFFCRLVFPLPSPGEAFLNLVSQAFSAAASAMMLVTASSPISIPTWEGAQQDGLPTGGLCDVNDLLLKAKTSIFKCKAKRSSVLSLQGEEEKLPTCQLHGFALPSVNRVVILVLLKGSQERPKLSYNQFLHFRKDSWSFKENNKQCCCSHLELPLE